MRSRQGVFLLLLAETKFGKNQNINPANSKYKSRQIQNINPANSKSRFKKFKKLKKFKK